MLQLLTATGARPAAWALCERWMAAQDYAGPVRWIIVDDGPEPQPVAFQRAGWELVWIRPDPLWQPGQNTQARNLAEGLKLVDPASPVAVIEDDDYYAPSWLRVALERIRHVDAAGEIRSRYYNVATRCGRQLVNSGHASLCSTIVRGDGVRVLANACSLQPKFIDLALWRHYQNRRKCLFDGHRVCGIKGLPGRAGIGMGHQPQFGGQHDPDGSLLRAWIGADARAYL